MEWRGQGVLLTVRKHGETSVIINALSKDHGHYAGLIKGGMSRRMQPVLQPGAQLDLVWRARLHEHLGFFRVELVKSRAPGVFHDRLALAGYSSTCALAAWLLPEREPNVEIYEATVGLLDRAGHATDWLAGYVRWELHLLKCLGYGLQLHKCAATGTSRDLVYVSPKSGRAVSRKAAGQWANRLLPLPPVLLGQEAAGQLEISEALQTTGYFLKRALIAQRNVNTMPEARNRFAAILRQGA